jgi:exopolysaccharide production protein ExoQ
MPPLLATVIYLLIVAYLLRRDIQQKPNVTPALWIPTVWVFISGTRFFSQWLDTFGISLGGTSVEEGSPIDAAFFLVMTLLGVSVLVRRRIYPAQFVRHNPWVAFFLFFCLFACIWSDFPFVAFKRWTKLFGQVVMVIVVLTEPDPQEAVIRLFKRFAYVVVPISYLFIKYFPELGRGFDSWTGQGADIGITLDKNALGYDCMLILIVIVWQFICVWQQPGRILARIPRTNKEFFEIGTDVIFFVATVLLLLDAHSKTSLVCTVLAILIAYILGIKWLKPERLTFYFLVAVIVVAVLAHFGFFTFFITQILHKDMTLTDRTQIWEVLLKWDINPIFGTGYESFWLGERREEMWREFPILKLNSAHNGYLQTYLDMGILGLIATLALVISGYYKARRSLFTNFNFARYRLGFWLAFLVYNCTEVALRTHSVPLFGFLLAVIDFPVNRSGSTRNDLASRNNSSETDYEF